MSYKLTFFVQSLFFVIICASSSRALEREERFSLSSLVPSFLNPFGKAEKTGFSFATFLPGIEALTEKEDRCKDPLKYAVSGAVKAVLSRLMGPLLIPQTLKNAQTEMAGIIVEQSIEIGLKEKNIAKAVAGPIGAKLRMVPGIGEKLDNYAEPLMEKTIIGFLGTLCEQVNCCFD